MLPVLAERDAEEIRHHAAGPPPWSEHGIYTAEHVIIKSLRRHVIDHVIDPFAFLAHTLLGTHDIRRSGS